MAHPDKTPAHIRFNDRNHVKRPLLGSPRALRWEESLRG